MNNLEYYRLYLEYFKFCLKNAFKLKFLLYENIAHLFVKRHNKINVHFRYQ